MGSNENVGMKHKVLVFGLTTLDIINICEKFPEEDEDVRVLNQYWQKGGNAANTSEVLAQCDGIEAHLFSAFAADNGMSDFARKSLEKSNVVTHHCAVLNSSGFPTSCCIVAKNTGSRTILHGRNGMPEIKNEYFKMIDLQPYSWVHFEGRGFPYLTEMVTEAAMMKGNRGMKFKISVEFEKPSRYDNLISSNIANLADFLFISKDIAKHMGFNNANETVINVREKLNLKQDLIVICAWGENGANAVDSHGNIYHADASPPKLLQDTLGAGDTFVAGIISSQLNGHCLQKSLQFACELAGKKCGQYGFENLIGNSN